MPTTTQPPPFETVKTTGVDSKVQGYYIHKEVFLGDEGGCQQRRNPSTSESYTPLLPGSPSLTCTNIRRRVYASASL